jgi:hypothetical protein
MSDTQERGTPIVRLTAGEDVHLDVEFCDLVPPNRGSLEESIRFKGRRLGPDGKPGELVRVFVDAAMAEPVMRRTGLLRGPMPVLPVGETSLPIPLTRRRLTLRRVERPNRPDITWLDIRPREGVAAAADDQLLADYRWALAQARNEFAPLLQQDGYPVGATELLTITDTLVHARRRDRHQEG